MAATSTRTRRAVTGTDEAPNTVVPENTEEGTGSVGTPVEGNEGQDVEAPEEAADENNEGGEKAEEKDAVVDPFAVLEEAKDQTAFQRGPSAIDYEAVTSPRVKADLMKSFNGYKPAAIPGKSGVTYWVTQKFPTAEMAAAYFEQAKKYATFRSWTFRSAWMKDVNGTMVNVKADETVKPTILRFAAKPKEIRNAKA